MTNNSFYYFHFQLVVGTAYAIAKSETPYFPMKKVIQFAEEYNTREIKRDAKRTDTKYRNSSEMVKFPYFNVEKMVQISEEDFNFFLEDKNFYFVIE